MGSKYLVIIFSALLLQWHGFAYNCRPTLSKQTINVMNSNKVSSLNRDFRMKALALPLPMTEVQRVALNSFKSLFDIRQLTTRLAKFKLGWKTGLLIIATLYSRFKAKVTAKVLTAANAMESGWKKRGYGNSFARTREVWFFAIAFAFKYLSSEKLKKGNPAIYSSARRELAIMLRDKLLELGPTFIKLGQLLSTRIDVLPKEYIEALVLLQDQVPGFPGEVAVRILEEELGKPIEELYDSFDRTPLAAASLGQVHVAFLNGRKLAVKVQRQGLKELFDMDLKNIKVLAQLLDKFDPKTDGAQRDWVSIYDESAKLLYKEINYESEALNSIRFKTNFQNTPWVKVPEVYLNMTTTRVITMEFVPGIKINDIKRIEEAGIDRELLAKRSAESYLSQLCRHGYFHCDPHPGNVACDDKEGGRLIYYDFGMMDELQPQVRAGLVDLIFGVFENEPRDVCDALEMIGVLRQGVDRISIEKIARFFLNDFNKGIDEGQWTNQLPKEEQQKILKKRRQQLGQDLFSVGSDVPFKFPPTFTFVFRAFTSLDGIGKGLDPQYDLVRLSQPYLRELIDLRDGSAFLSLVKSWGKKLGWRPVDIAEAIQSPRKIANLERIISKMEQGDLKVRVRVLESERAFQRSEILQNNMAAMVAASLFLNAGLMTANAASGGKVTMLSKVALALAGLFGLQVPIGVIKLKAFDKKFAVPQ